MASAGRKSFKSEKKERERPRSRTDMPMWQLQTLHLSLDPPRSHVIATALPAPPLRQPDSSQGSSRSPKKWIGSMVPCAVVQIAWLCWVCLAEHHSCRMSALSIADCSYSCTQTSVHPRRSKQQAAKPAAMKLSVQCAMQRSWQRIGYVSGQLNPPRSRSQSSVLSTRPSKSPWSKRSKQLAWLSHHHQPPARAALKEIHSLVNSLQRNQLHRPQRQQIP
mmetsp:Transcript_26719/g.49029  ORF Transcript_26719/g.49029 Transcript_26719/m.49029 type:complete len:220 (-) Transcript_26719:239-898(-)